MKPGFPKLVNTPLMLQGSVADNGACALGSILGFYGRYPEMEELRTKCGSSRNDKMEDSIMVAAEAYGLKATKQNCSSADLFQFAPPFIIYKSADHFVVVEGTKKDHLYINDPASGKKIINHEQIDSWFCGTAICFSTTEKFKKGGQPYRLSKDIFKWIKGSRRAILFTLLAGMLLSLPISLVPYLSRFYIDNILLKGNHNWMLQLILACVVTIAIIIALQVTLKTVLAKFQIKLSLKLNFVFLSRLFRLPMIYFLQRNRTEIATRMELCNNIAYLIAGPLASFAISIFNLIIFGISLFLFAPSLAWLAFLSAGITVFALSRITKSGRSSMDMLIKERSALIGTTIVGINMIETLKATGKESEYFERWIDNLVKLNNVEFKAGRISMLSTIVPVFMSSITNIIILFAGSFLVMQGELTVGGLVGLIALVQGFSGFFQGTSDIGKNVQHLKACFRAINEISEYPVHESARAILPASAEPVQDPAIALEVKSLVFGYSLHKDPIIKNVSFKLEKGKSLAIVGKSGSGKSTIAKLATGLFHQWDGAVSVSGRPLESYTSHELSEKLALVEQNVFLFEGTIRENLTLWNEKINDDEIIEASKIAGLHEIVCGKPGGYAHLIIESGRNFSGGQKQRLEIARNLINNPEILILDEATSAMDNETERHIMDNLLNLDCALLIIAHRLSTVRYCDEIMVLDHGEIKERGTHEQLFQQKGLYFELYNLQEIQ